MPLLSHKILSRQSNAFKSEIGGKALKATELGWHGEPQGNTSLITIETIRASARYMR
jgi:hypothetical protein